MIQFRGTDWGESFGNGVMRGIAIGKQYRASKAQYDYQNAIEDADAQYEEAMKAAGDDKDKQLAAATARDEARSKALAGYHAYVGDPAKAHEALKESESSRFDTQYNLNGEKDPYASPNAGMNLSDLSTLSSFASLGGGGKQPVMVASNGPVQEVIPAEKTAQTAAPQGVPTRPDGTIAATKVPVPRAPQTKDVQQPEYDAKGAEAYKAELFAEYQKDPSARIDALIKGYNRDKWRMEQGETIGLTKDGKLQLYKEGKPMGNPFQLPPETLNRMVGRDIDDDVASRFGANPNAAGGVGRVGPTEPAGNDGGQGQQRPQGMITADNVPQLGTGAPSADDVLDNYPRGRQNETIRTKQKQQVTTSQGLSDTPNGSRPSATEDLQQMLAQVRGMKRNPELDPLVKYLIQNEAKVDNYYNAYFRRFRRWPSGAERSRIIQLAQLKENQRYHASLESNADIRTAEYLRDNRAREALARETEARKAMNLGETNVTDAPEKFTLGEAFGKEERRKIYGENGLPTGNEAITIKTDEGNTPTVFVPEGMPKENASKAYNFMVEQGYGQPINTNKGTTEWYVGKDANGQIITISYRKALKMCLDDAAKKKAAEDAKIAAAKAKVKAENKARLKQTREDFAKYKKDPEAFQKEYAARKKGMDK